MLTQRHTRQKLSCSTTSGSSSSRPFIHNIWGRYTLSLGLSACLLTWYNTCWLHSRDTMYVCVWQYSSYLSQMSPMWRAYWWGRLYAAIWDCCACTTAAICVWSAAGDRTLTCNASRYCSEEPADAPMCSLSILSVNSKSLGQLGEQQL